MQANLHYNTSNQFNKYSNNSVTINETEFTGNLIVSRDKIDTVSINNISDIDTLYIDEIISKYKPDLIIFGTGSTIKMPDIKILLQLQKQQIGFEVMPIPALCRTFNYLSGEDRNVVAIVLF